MLTLKGDYEYKHSGYENAANTYNYALKLYSYNVKALYSLGNLCTETQHYSQAEDYYVQALALKPNYLKARIKYALLLSDKLHNPDMAIREYETAIREEAKSLSLPFFKNFSLNNKKIALVYNNLGLAYSKKALATGYDSDEGAEYLNRAEESFRKSTELNPSNFEMHYNTALAYQIQDKSEKAVVEYCKAMKIVPLNPEIRYNLGIVLMKLKKYKEAKQELEIAGFILQTANNNGKMAEYVHQTLNDVIEKELTAEETDSQDSGLEQTQKEAKESLDKSKQSQTASFFEFDIKSCKICKEYLSKKS
jgi:tetratricopeptide (TPR) repeat protein